MCSEEEGGVGEAEGGGGGEGARKLFSDFLSTVVIRNYDELGAHPVSTRPTPSTQPSPAPRCLTDSCPISTL